MSPSQSDIDRFTSYLVKTEDGCHIHTNKSTVPSGHVKFWWNGGPISAHRFAWMVAFGDIPDGMCVLHKCDNPPCCNPDHLFLGTQLDNIVDRGRKGRTARLFGSDHPRALLTPASVQEIRRLIQLGEMTQRAIAAKFMVTPATITDIKTGRRYATQ